jgi:hypothetical protein
MESGPSGIQGAMTSFAIEHPEVFIASFLTLTICVLAMLGRPVPLVLSLSLATIVGYSFGSKMTEARTAARRTNPPLPVWPPAAPISATGPAPGGLNPAESRYT